MQTGGFNASDNIILSQFVYAVYIQIILTEGVDFGKVI